MKRRTVLTGVGASIAGISTAFGAGAFTQVEAERTFTIDTATDENAFIALREHTGSGSAVDFSSTQALAQTSDGVLKIDLSAGTYDGDGVNLKATTQLGTVDDPAAPSSVTKAAFEVVNQTDKTVDISATVTDGAGGMLRMVAEKGFANANVAGTSSDLLANPITLQPSVDEGADETDTAGVALIIEPGTDESLSINTVPITAQTVSGN